MPTPTEETYALLQSAADTMNRELFEGQLPPSLLTLQRQPRTIGYFSAKRFANRQDAMLDEIALNPVYFSILSPLFILSVIGHEQAHQWQSHFGKPSRGRYHNDEWANKMEEIGLMPSSTNRPGGRRVGQRVGHYIIPEGRFIRVASEIIKAPGFALPWMDRYPPRRLADLDSSLDPGVTVDVDPDKRHERRRGELEPEGREASAEEARSTVSLPSPPSSVRPRREMEYVDQAIRGVVPNESITSPLSSGFKPAQPAADATQLAKRTDASNRARYVCATCGIKMWGKPGLRVECMDCQRPLVIQSPRLAEVGGTA